MEPQHEQSRPGDFVGRDSSGRIKIDRVLPLPWLIGIIGAIVLNAIAIYYGQQQMVEKVSELKVDVKALTQSTIALNGQNIEHNLRIQSLERRLDTIEARSK